MNKAVSPLWQHMGQQQPAQSARHPYMMALERKRKRQQAKQQTQQQEARILPVAPASTQPFSNFLADNLRSKYPAFAGQITTDQTSGMLPWVAALRAK